MKQSENSNFDQHDSLRQRTLEAVQKSYLYHGPLKAMSIILHDLKKVQKEILEHYDISSTRENVERMNMLFLAIQQLQNYPLKPEDLKRAEKFRSECIALLLPISSVFHHQHESGYGKMTSLLFNTVNAYYPKALDHADVINSAYEDGFTAFLEKTIDISAQVSNRVERAGKGVFEFRRKKKGEK